MFSIIGGDGKEYGPVSVEQLREWMAANRVSSETRAKRVGTDDWHPLRGFPEFAPAGTGEAAAATAAPPAIPATPTQPERIEFTGDWTEYFKIWIVNVLLTIVTLGIYAAWAKVRKRRYFHANTRIFGHAFEYLANPVRILYGNLIVGGAFFIYVLLGVFAPFAQLPVMLIFAIAVPWFVVRALAFNARNTAWRGLRFNFSGTYGEAAVVFLLWSLLMPFTLGLIYPLIAQKRKEFIVRRHAYGTSPFTFSGDTGGFYRIYLVSWLFFLPVFICYVGLIGMAVAKAVQSRGRPPQLPMEAFGMLGMFLLIAVPFAIVGTFYLRSRLFNFVWANTSLAGNRFVASMRARDLFLLYLVNSIVTLFTLGLLHPWAAVRTFKYQVGCLEILPAGNVDAFVAAAQPPVSAIGDAATDFFDLDLGFGL